MLIPINSGLILLHNPLPAEFSIATSPIAMNTTLSMAVDIADSLVDIGTDFDLAVLPPSTPYMFYLAALQLVSYHDDADGFEWRKNLNSLRQASWMSGRRWLIAGTECPFPKISSVKANDSQSIIFS